MRVKIPSTGFVPIEALIEYHKRRERDCRKEIAQAEANVDRLDEKTYTNMLTIWREERRIARDTVSALECVLSRKSVK